MRPTMVAITVCCILFYENYDSMTCDMTQGRLLYIRPMVVFDLLFGPRGEAKDA